MMWIMAFKTWRHLLRAVDSNRLADGCKKKEVLMILLISNFDESKFHFVKT